MRGSSNSHQMIIRQLSDGHQPIIRWSSDGHQTVIRLSSDGHRTVNIGLSDSHQMVIRLSSDSHRTVNRGYQTVSRRSSVITIIWDLSLFSHETVIKMYFADIRQSIKTKWHSKMMIWQNLDIGINLILISQCERHLAWYRELAANLLWLTDIFYLLRHLIYPQIHSPLLLSTNAFISTRSFQLQIRLWYRWKQKIISVRCEIFDLRLLSFPQNERKIYKLRQVSCLSLYILWGKCV